MEPSDDEVLRETLAALEMPEPGLRRWIARSQSFCRDHGERHYRELLAIYRRCLELLDGEPGR